MIDYQGVEDLNGFEGMGSSGVGGFSADFGGILGGVVGGPVGGAVGSVLGSVLEGAISQGKRNKYASIGTHLKRKAKWSGRMGAKGVSNGAAMGSMRLRSMAERGRSKGLLEY